MQAVQLSALKVGDRFRPTGTQGGEPCSAEGVYPIFEVLSLAGDSKLYARAEGSTDPVGSSFAVGDGYSGQTVELIARAAAPAMDAVSRLYADAIALRQLGHPSVAHALTFAATVLDTRKCPGDAAVIEKIADDTSALVRELS